MPASSMTKTVTPGHLRPASFQLNSRDVKVWLSMPAAFSRLSAAIPDSAAPCT